MKNKIIGIIAGLISGLFGAGGGMILVPAFSFLNKMDEAKEKYSQIDSSAVPESVSEFYLMITEALTEK